MGRSVFGRTVRGLELLQKIQPNESYTIKILRIGADAQAFKADAAAFNSLTEEARKYNGAAEPSSTSHFDDPDKVLPQDVPRAKNFNFKLANFQRFTGQRIYARVYATLPQPTEGEKTTPAKFSQKVARDLGITKNGVFAAYFADKGEWYLWVGDNLMPMFNSAGLKTMERKKEIYTAVKTQAADYTAEARASRGPDHPLPRSDISKYSVDAMLDLLILTFEPKPKA